MRRLLLGALLVLPTMVAVPSVAASAAYCYFLEVSIPTMAPPNVLICPFPR